MYEKILQKLKLQRGTNSAVSDRSLEDMARSLEAVITTDELLIKADFSKAIQSLDGNINHYTSERVKKLQEDQKVAEEAAKKKAEEEEETKDPEKQKRKAKDEPPAWAKAMMEQNQKLAEELTAIKTSRLTENRYEILKKKLEGLPEYYAKPILVGFTRLTFTDESQFTSYLEEVGSNATAFIQAAKENGLNNFTPFKSIRIPEETGETPLLGDARKIVKEIKTKQNKQSE